MTQIKFSKMHGCGNDFMVIDAVNQNLQLTSEFIQRWSNRHTGVGFDQLLIVEPTTNENARLKYRIFNADGGEVGQCGNGARCFAAFVKRIGLVDTQQFWVETKYGLLQLCQHADGQVTVDMGFPQFAPKDIPCLVAEEKIAYPLNVNGQLMNYSVISFGNPHCVLFADDINSIDLGFMAQTITAEKIFPQGVNLGFAQVISSEQINLRVHERGVGETLACGSGACAAVVTGIRLNKLAPKVEVNLTGGKVTVAWEGEGYSVKMTGPAEHVYDGTINV